MEDHSCKRRKNQHRPIFPPKKLAPKMRDLRHFQNSVNAFEIKHFYAQCLFLAVLVELVLVALVLIAPMLLLLELLALCWQHRCYKKITPMLLASQLVAPVLLAPVPLLLELLALVHAAPVLLAMCYKHQCKKHIASDTMCYGINGMSIGHSGIVLRMHCPKISTGQEKLAPTRRHGRHVFATL